MVEINPRIHDPPPYDGPNRPKIGPLAEIPPFKAVRSTSTDINDYPLRLPPNAAIRFDLFTDCRHRRDSAEFPKGYKDFSDVLVQPRAPLENPCYSTHYSSWSSMGDSSFKLFRHADRTIKQPKKALCKVKFHYYQSATIDIKLEQNTQGSVKGWGEDDDKPWDWPFEGSPLRDQSTFGLFRGVFDYFDDNTLPGYTIYYNTTAPLARLISRGVDGSIEISMAALMKVDTRKERERALDEIVTLVLAVVNQRKNFKARAERSSNSDTSSSVVASASAVVAITSS